MSYLTFRAEQAVLGALLAAEPLPDQLGRLRADHFGAPGHRQLYETITALRYDHPSLSGEALIDAAAQRGPDPGASRRQLWMLRTQCPDPRHLTAYAAMVQAAAFRREVAAEAERAEAEAGYSVSGDGTVHQRRFAEALTDQSRRYDVLVTIEPGRTQPAIGRASVGPSAEAAERRAQHEHALLADLLQNPRQAFELATFMPDTTFRDPQRREIYRTIRTLAEDGEAIDEVTVGWRIAHLRAAARMYGAEPGTQPPSDVYLDRLARTVTSVSAVEIGRGLVAEDIRSSARSRANAIIRAVDSGAVTRGLSVDPLDSTLTRPTNGRPGPTPWPGR
ncbi:DnaB-like helicase N-terminal domain-containing protein [Cryptosporangium sp. NPDC048952]|uniref:DnaB-like helicase N-terminal domain-containing protein n=1 Tax=Cryptosporangium sp. NPDC048952 TaxID=3363961 RepID=UPI00371C349B